LLVAAQDAGLVKLHARAAPGGDPAAMWSAPTAAWRSHVSHDACYLAAIESVLGKHGCLGGRRSWAAGLIDGMVGAPVAFRHTYAGPMLGLERASASPR